MNEMQSMLADSINRLLAEQITPALLSGAETGAWPDDLWQLIKAQGFDRALAPESSGGSGLDWWTVYPLVLAAGKYALPLPLPETLLATWLLGRAGLDVPDGTYTVAQLGQESVQAASGGWMLGAAITDVPWAASADYIVLGVAIDGVAHVGVVPTADVDIATELNIAREPRATVTFPNNTTIALTPVQGIPAECVTYFGAMLRSAQMAGAAERMLEQTVQYASDRVQFGRTLASFQAIQQHTAVLACEGAAMAAAASYAFSCADGTAPELAIAAAKVRTGTAAGKVASISHAVHGAIGFTYEHSLHYCSRRLWSWRSEFGSHAWWARHLGQACIAAGPEQWWPAVTQGSLAFERL